MENVDWLWTVSGALWMIGAIAAIRLVFIGKPDFAIMNISSAIFLGLLGISIFFCGIGVAEGDSEPWKYVAVMFIIGDMYATYLIWKVTRRHQ